MVQTLSSQSTLPSEKGGARLSGVGILIGTPILYARTRTGEAALQHKDQVWIRLSVSRFTLYRCQC